MKVDSDLSARISSWLATDLKILARLHAYELDEATVLQLSKSDFPQSLAINIDDENQAQPLVEVMRRSIGEIQQQVVTKDLLDADFAAIYLNGAHDLSPNESAWLDEDHLERQEPMFEIRDWYRKYGLRIENWRTRSDDNIALQILFLSEMLAKRPLPLEDIGHFMDFHILRWIDDFAQGVFRRAETGFYASLGLLSARYLNGVRDLVAEWHMKPRLGRNEVAAMTRRESSAEVHDPLFYTSQSGGW